jgi:hypothetical protein
MEQCCPNHFLGFCLEDGSPIILVIEGNVQTGWINIETGVFTTGAPPVGTVMCAGAEVRFLDCDTDSITVCQPEVTSSFSSVSASLSNVTLLAANPNRKRAVLFMDGTSTAFVKFGATASTTSFSIKIPAQTYYELSFGYVGIIDAIWSGTANGAVRITEFV